MRGCGMLVTSWPLRVASGVERLSVNPSGGIRHKRTYNQNCCMPVTQTM